MTKEIKLFPFYRKEDKKAYFSEYFLSSINFNGMTEKLIKERPGMPLRVAKATNDLSLSHVVITSDDRDDLPDGGAEHFVKTIIEIRKNNPETTIEILTPDFLRKGDVYKKVVDAEPDVFNHNIETVPSNYTQVRPGSRYFQSINLLKEVKNYNNKIF